MMEESLINLLHHSLVWLLKRAIARARRLFGLLGSPYEHRV